MAREKDAKGILKGTIKDIEKGNLIGGTLGECGSPEGCLLGLMHKHATQDKVVGSGYRCYPSDSKYTWKPEAKKALRAVVRALVAAGLSPHYSADPVRLRDQEAVVYFASDGNRYTESGRVNLVRALRDAIKSL